MQAGRPALIQKDGGEMLIAIVLDRPLADAKALVDDPAAFTQEMTRILLEKQVIHHPGTSKQTTTTPCRNESGEKMKNRWNRRWDMV